MNNLNASNKINKIKNFEKIHLSLRLVNWTLDIKLSHNHKAGLVCTGKI